MQNHEIYILDVQNLVQRQNLTPERRRINTRKHIIHVNIITIFSGWPLPMQERRAVEYLLNSRETTCVTSSPWLDISDVLNGSLSSSLTVALRHAMLSSMTVAGV